MGLDVSGYIEGEVPRKEILRILKKIPNEVEITLSQEATFFEPLREVSFDRENGDHVQASSGFVSITNRDNGKVRTPFVHYESGVKSELFLNRGPFTAISLASDEAGFARKVLQMVVEHYGGYFRDERMDDDEYQYLLKKEEFAPLTPEDRLRDRLEEVAGDDKDLFKGLMSLVSKGKDNLDAIYEALADYKQGLQSTGPKP